MTQTLSSVACMIGLPYSSTRGLKILVSVVRFRPGPPKSKALVSDNGGFLHFERWNRNASGGTGCTPSWCTYNVHMNSLQFEREARKATGNLKKQGISFEEAKSAFYDEQAKLIDDPDHSADEERFILLGLSFSLRLVVVCHCYRSAGDVIRIISARKATPYETKSYKQR